MELMITVHVPDGQDHWRLPQLLNDMRILSLKTGCTVRTRVCGIVYTVWISQEGDIAEFNGDQYVFGVGYCINGWRKCLGDGKFGEPLT